jgi:predicted pyridoxine 5'-phosphate oxidase superfamily flavin-nucleotide-binding protein
MIVERANLCVSVSVVNNPGSTLFSSGSRLSTLDFLVPATPGFDPCRKKLTIFTKSEVRNPKHALFQFQRLGNKSEIRISNVDNINSFEFLGHSCFEFVSPRLNSKKGKITISTVRLTS